MSIVANLLLSFLLSFALVYTIMPVVIRIALRKKLVAEIDDRSSHTELVPTLGGIPIFLAVLLSSFVLVPSPAFGNVQYILAGLLIIFLTGAKDDIEALSARKKTLGLLLGIGILIFAGDIRLQSMYGLFGYYGNLPYLISVALTYFTIFVITNAFNLIDGINGLAGSLGAVVAISFGVWFGMSGLTAYGVLALAMVGGLIAFLRYNVSPAKIFMGDSGSLVLGATCAVFAIKFIDLCFSGNVVTPYCFNHPVAVAISFLIVPLFDTLRVFITRMYRGKSPFRPDRRHIHHLLIDTGRSHTEATIILLLVNITFISIVFALDEVVGLHYILLLEITLATALTLILHRRARNARIEALNSMVV